MLHETILGGMAHLDWCLSYVGRKAEYAAVWWCVGGKGSLGRWQGNVWHVGDGPVGMGGHRWGWGWWGALNCVVGCVACAPGTRLPSRAAARSWECPALGLKCEGMPSSGEAENKPTPVQPGIWGKRVKRCRLGGGCTGSHQQCAGNVHAEKRTNPERRPG